MYRNNMKPSTNAIERIKLALPGIYEVAQRCTAVRTVEKMPEDLEQVATLEQPDRIADRVEEFLASRLGIYADPV